jgi:membrane-bound inhibitor of C-type lysozyme
VVGAAGAVAQDTELVHYTCADGTKLQATFSPPGTSMGSVKLVYSGSPSGMVLPQAVSADGGRYTEGNVEFWIKGRGATLTRAGRSTTCRTGEQGTPPDARMKAVSGPLFDPLYVTL